MKTEIKNAEDVKKFILLLKDKYLTMRSADINQELINDQHWKYLTMKSAGIGALTEVLDDYTRDSAITTLQVISKISSEYDVFYN